MVRNLNVVALVFAVVVLMRLGSLQADPLPGTNTAPDLIGPDTIQAFNLYFDEFGNGSSIMTSNGVPFGSSSPAPGSLSSINGGSYLTYALPTNVNLGTVYILSSSAGSYLGNGIYAVSGNDLNSGKLVEAIQFITVSTTSYMQFYATPPAGSPPAATGFPAGLVPGAGTADNYDAVVETAGTFSYVPGPVEGGFDNEYFGVTVVPEPSESIAILGLLGMVGVGLAFCRARAIAPAISR